MSGAAIRRQAAGLRRATTATTATTATAAAPAAGLRARGGRTLAAALLLLLCGL
jgi:hypothetical protein